MAASKSLDGQTAIVTGASAGIGEATAHALAREGAHLALGRAAASDSKKSPTGSRRLRRRDARGPD